MEISISFSVTEGYGYKMNGKFYRLAERNELVKQFTLDDIDEIIWIRERDPFSAKGNLINCTLFNDMKRLLLEEIFSATLAPILR